MYKAALRAFKVNKLFSQTRTVMPFTEAKSGWRGSVEFALGFKMELEAPKDFLVVLPELKTTSSIPHCTDSFLPDIYLNNVHLP